jgi:hypothetical protein
MGEKFSTSPPGTSKRALLEALDVLRRQPESEEGKRGRGEEGKRGRGEEE